MPAWFKTIVVTKLKELYGPIKESLQIPLQKALLSLTICCIREEAVALGDHVGESGGFTSADWGRKYNAPDQAPEVTVWYSLAQVN